MTEPKPPTPPVSSPSPAPGAKAAPGAGVPAGNPPAPAGPGGTPAAAAGNPPPPSDLRILSEDAPYQPPPRPKTRWFGFSTVVFLVACGFGYYKYRDYVEHPPPPPPKPAVELRAVPASANPLTAFKQARAIIKDAGDKHKSAYATVDAMMDGPGKPRPTGGWPSSGPAPGTEAAAAAPAQPAESAPAEAPTPAPVVPGTAVNLPAATTAAAARAPATVAAAPPPPTHVHAPPAKPAVALRDMPLPSMVGQDLYMPAGSPPVGRDFLRWAHDVKISGVRTGPATRINIDALTFKPGELVERTLAITFEGYDETAHALRFRDAKGAVICFRR